MGNFCNEADFTLYLLICKEDEYKRLYILYIYIYIYIYIWPNDEMCLMVYRIK